MKCDVNWALYLPWVDRLEIMRWWEEKWKSATMPRVLCNRKSSVVSGPRAASGTSTTSKIGHGWEWIVRKKHGGHMRKPRLIHSCVNRFVTARASKLRWAGNKIIFWCKRSIKVTTSISLAPSLQGPGTRSLSASESNQSELYRWGCFNLPSSTLTPHMVLALLAVSWMRRLCDETKMDL